MVNMYGANRAHHLFLQNTSVTSFVRSRARGQNSYGSIYGSGFRYKDFAWCPPPPPPRTSSGWSFLTTVTAVAGLVMGLFSKNNNMASMMYPSYPMTGSFGFGYNTSFNNQLYPSWGTPPYAGSTNLGTQTGGATGTQSDGAKGTQTGGATSRQSGGATGKQGGDTDTQADGTASSSDRRTTTDSSQSSPSDNNRSGRVSEESQGGASQKSTVKPEDIVNYQGAFTVHDDERGASGDIKRSSCTMSDDKDASGYPKTITVGPYNYKFERVSNGVAIYSSVNGVGDEYRLEKNNDGTFALNQYAGDKGAGTKDI